MGSEIKAVVLDFGGVMTTTTMPERVRACVERFGIDWRRVEEGFAKYRRVMDGGFISIDDMYDLIWADADITLAPDVKERILEEDYASFLEGYRNERTREWMKALKGGGYRIGILTNMPLEFSRRFRKTFADFIELADAMVISSEVRMFKPQKRIYELMRERLGLPAESILFVDDVESNCAGARAAGWKALRFAGNEQTEKGFAALVGA